MDLHQLKDLPPDNLIQIALNLDIDQLRDLCQVDKTLNQKLCQNELFWESLFRRDFPTFQHQSGDKPPNYWKDLYEQFSKQGIFKLVDGSFELVAIGRNISDFNVLEGRYGIEENGYMVISSGNKLYVKRFGDRHLEIRLIAEFESNIKQIMFGEGSKYILVNVEVSPVGNILLENGNVYHLNENSELRLIQENVNLLLSSGYLDKNGILHKQGSDYALPGGRPQGPTTQNLNLPQVDVKQYISGRYIEWILDADGNLYDTGERPYPFQNTGDSISPTRTGIKKILSGGYGILIIGKDGKVYEGGSYNNLGSQSSTIKEDEQLSGKRVKDIASPFYANFSDEIRTIAKDTEFPKHERMGEIHQIEVIGGAHDKSLYVIAALKPSPIQTDQKTIVELFSSPEYISYDFGKKIGLNHEITVTLKNGLRYQSIVYVQGDQIYPKLIEIDYPDVERLIKSPNLKSFDLGNYIGRNVEVFIRLKDEDTIYKGLIFVENGMMYPPV